MYKNMFIAESHKSARGEQSKGMDVYSPLLLYKDFSKSSGCFDDNNIIILKGIHLDKHSSDCLCIFLANEYLLSTLFLAL